MDPLYHAILIKLAKEAASHEVIDRETMDYYLRYILRPAVGLVADTVFSKIDEDGYLDGIRGRDKISYSCSGQLVLMMLVSPISARPLLCSDS